MNTIKYLINGDCDPEMIIALISGFPFHSFVELEYGVEAYIAGNDHDEAMSMEIQRFLYEKKLDFKLEEIAFENWNKKWEEHFEPVMVDGFCCIRADFHPSPEGIPYDLIINPKMAFGTGHHETTRVVISMMRKLDFQGAKVLDFGTGTGVLAILAEKLGANKILAIDNDPLATENAAENTLTNHTLAVEVKTGSIEDLPKEETYDIIIANINLNVLTASVASVRERIRPNGLLLLSGVMVMHKEVLLNTYQHAGFEVQKIREEGEWLGVLCVFKSA